MKKEDIVIAAVGFLSFWVLLSHQGTLVGGQDATCPLNFTILEDYPLWLTQAKTNVTSQCNVLRAGLNLVVAERVSKNGSFLLDNATAVACITSYKAELKTETLETDLKNKCQIDSYILTKGSGLCPNIETLDVYGEYVNKSSRDYIKSSCGVNLNDNAACSGCTVALLTNKPFTNTSTCLDYTEIYAAAVVSHDGKIDKSVADCIFFPTSTSGSSGDSKWRKARPIVYAFVGIVGGMVVGSAIFYLVWRHKRRQRLERLRLLEKNTLETSMEANTSLVRFTMDQIKAATHKFSRYTIIGSGGFGNVYKGRLDDGTEVAVKRFKNCAPSGDPEFVHEVEMISSVRHRNLVPLVGWCVGTSQLEGHQRIIVFEYMPNGSLQDHLFGSKKSNLDWPTRQKIAIGMARGLAYLHSGAQPAIIHRDIKASNILLDGNFNARVADFGLAKFAPEGVSHLTTGVAGTQGYVAPEYVMYGQLTDKSDVYSFGIVLLELLTGQKALVPGASGNPLPVADWAWQIVKRGKVIDVLYQPMDNLGPEEVIERFILTALLCAHPQVLYRPTMTQALKMLESDLALPPTMPERPLPITLDISDIESFISSTDNSRGGRSLTSAGSSEI